VMGDTVLMPCQMIQSSGVVWTRRPSKTHDGFSYIYMNGTIMVSDEDAVRFSVVNASTLRIYNVHPADSGWYDCSDTDRTRIVDYHLIAERTFFAV